MGGMARRRVTLTLPGGEWEWIDTYAAALRLTPAEFVEFMLVLARQAHQWGSDVVMEANQAYVGAEVASGLADHSMLRDAMAEMAEGPKG
jgi:hypothetical protein